MNREKENIRKLNIEATAFAERDKIKERPALKWNKEGECQEAKTPYS